MARSGQKIGPYTLIRKVGRGGFGEVWLAEKKTRITTTEFALKLAIQENPDIDAIQREAEVWKQASGHPNVLPIIEADIYNEYVVIVSEFARGGSLEGWLETHQGAAPSVDAAVEMISGILSGLEHLHGLHIIHRDLKPANVLLQGNRPRLADFGLARVLKSTMFSQTVAGTPEYMAPETFLNERSEQADLWAVGVILYQLLTGRLPFPLNERMSPWQKMAVITNQDVTPPPPSVPEPLREVIMRSLQKNPERRFRAASEMVALVVAANNSLKFKDREQSIPYPSPTVPVKPRRDAASFFIVIVLAIVLLCGVVWILRSNSSSGSAASPLPLRAFEFDTVTVDERGNVLNRSKGQARYFTEELGDGVTLDMVEIPGGTFMMGSPDNEESRSIAEGPQHAVTVRSFYMGKDEVTQAQWRAVASLPVVSRSLKLDPTENELSGWKGGNRPANQVSWEEAIEFCARLSKATGREHTLPSEAKWEYACRAGTTTPFAFGDTITPQLVNYMSFFPYRSAPKGNHENYRGKTIEVGSTEYANQFGLFDMHGNVWEWCMDSWHDNYNGAPTDGSVWEGGDASSRVARSGSWDCSAAACRAASRFKFLPAEKNPGKPGVVGIGTMGFRVVCPSTTR